MARGAAIMAGTGMEYKLSMAFTEYIPNVCLAAVASECMEEIGPPDWSKEDYELARKFLFSNNQQVLESAREKIEREFGEEQVEKIMERPLDSKIHPFRAADMRLEAGSTDVGDVGFAVPTLNLAMAACCIGTVGHTWQMTAQTGSSIAQKGLLAAAKVLALSCVRTMDRPDVMEAAKAEVRKRNGGTYVCPLPASVQPPLESY